jgi:hypothetical protein
MHRTTKTLRRPAPHPYDDDPAVPSTCEHCHLPPGNAAHDEQRIAQLTAGQDEHRRRTGETE